MRVLFLKCNQPLGMEAIKKYKNVQIIDSRLVAGEEHAKFAISQAQKAFQRGENISRDFFIEVLVCMSAQRQINKALKMFGLNNSRNIAVIGRKIPENLLKEYGCKKTTLKINYEDIKKAFNIDEKEIKAAGNKNKLKVLSEIIKERIALIAVE